MFSKRKSIDGIIPRRRIERISPGAFKIISIEVRGPGGAGSCGGNGCACRPKRHLELCRFCYRHDEKVELIDSDGLKGYYHPFCHSEILRSMREELGRRMSHAK